MTGVKAISSNEDLRKFQERQRPHRPKGLITPEEHHADKMDHDFNLGLNKDVLGALDYKAERVKALEKHCEEVKAQAKKEIEELKDMVQKLGEENLRLKKLLKEKGG